MSQVIVVDSSVVLKWFLRDEPQMSVAMRLFSLFQEGEFTFVVPDLLFYEVGNILVLKGKSDFSRVREHFSLLWSLPWFLMPLKKNLLIRTLEISSEQKLTFYDALFVATAEQSKGMLVTADQKLLAKIPQFHFVKSLQSFEQDLSLH